MTRRHVAIVVPGYPTERDEPGLAAVVDTIERLALTHDVSVVALRHPPVRSGYALAGARVVPLALGTLGGPAGRTVVIARGVTALWRLHDRHPIDVVHGLWADEPGAVAVVAARLLRRPSIVSVMGGELVALADIGYGAALGRGGRWTTSFSLRAADRVTAGSSYVADMIRAARPKAAAALAPMGVDTGTYRPAEASPEAPVVLFVGSLEPVKDPLLALRAFARLATGRPAARLVVAGDGGLRSALAAEIERLGLDHRVDLVGQAARSEMPDLYRRASALLVTSRHESQSLAAVEAAASAVPIVGTRVGALVDLEPLGAAITVRPGDAGGLAAALVRVLDDPMVAARMSAAGRAAALARYDLERTPLAWLDLYADLMRR